MHIKYNAGTDKINVIENGKLNSSSHNYIYVSAFMSPSEGVKALSTSMIINILWCFQFTCMLEEA